MHAAFILAFCPPPFFVLLHETNPSHLKAKENRNNTGRPTRMISAWRDDGDEAGSRSADALQGDGRLAASGDGFDLAET